MTDLFGVGGQELLDHVELAHAYRHRVDSLRELIEHFDAEIAHARERDHPGLRR